MKGKVIMEIGSNFEFDYNLLNNDLNKLVDNIEFNTKNIKYFDTGRNVIKYILKYKFNENKNCLLPDYLCESVIHPFQELNYGYKYYKVDSNFNIMLKDLESKLVGNDIILFINYFGFIQSDAILNKLKNLKEKYNLTIIEDATHSIFSKKDIDFSGDYIISSLRKWLPIPDGAVLMTDNTLNDIEDKNSYNKFTFNNLLGQFLKEKYLNNADIDKEIFLEKFSEAEEYIDSENNSINKITDWSYYILNRIDYSSLKEKRRDNYKILLNGLISNPNIDIIFDKLTFNVVPLGFPIKVANRKELKNHLINNNIYPPIHWKLSNDIPDNEHNVELSKSILTIPCDQRYGKEEMLYIIDTIKDFYDLGE